MRKLIGVLLLVTFTLSAQAQLQLANMSADSLDQYIQESMDESGLVGMAVGVIQDKELVYSKGFGEKIAGTGQAVDENTVFALASLSKAFTACAIGLLVDDGKLNWSDPVQKHLPWFKMYDPYVSSQITIEDLLCHRNGYNTFDGDLLWYTTSYDSKEILNRFSKLEPKHGFRNKYRHQNTMFIAAALVIEEISGMSWEDFVMSEILKPLGMNNSYTDIQDFTEQTNLAYPHVAGEKIAYQNFQNAIGAVGVNSSIKDLSIWAKMWINQGKHDGEEFLSRASWNKIVSPHTANAVSAQNWPTKHFDAAALGWFVEDMNGHYIMSHSGGLPGFLLNLIVIPEKESAIIVLTNGDKYLPFALSNVLKEQMLMEEPSRDWHADYFAYEQMKAEEKKEEEERRASLKNKRLKPYLPLDSLAGTYEDKMFGEAKVYREGSKHFIELTPAKELFTAELEHWYGNVYRAQFKDPFLPAAYIKFEYDTWMKPASFVIDLPNGDFHYFNLHFKRQN